MTHKLQDRNRPSLLAGNNSQNRYKYNLPTIKQRQAIKIGPGENPKVRKYQLTHCKVASDHCYQPEIKPR